MDQAGVLPNSLSPKMAEDGAVIGHAASAPVWLDGQYCSLFRIFAAKLKPGWQAGGMLQPRGLQISAGQRS
jgi:hypothetical protein